MKTAERQRCFIAYIHSHFELCQSNTVTEGKYEATVHTCCPIIKAIQAQAEQSGQI